MNAFRQILVNFLLFFSFEIRIIRFNHAEIWAFQMGKRIQSQLPQLQFYSGEVRSIWSVRSVIFEQKVSLFQCLARTESDSRWRHLQQQKYQASWNTEPVASPMNKTVGSVVNSDSHLDAALMILNVQEEVWFENLALSKEFVLNPVVFDIGQLYLIGTTNHTNQMHLICISPISRVCV